MEFERGHASICLAELPQTNPPEQPVFPTALVVRNQHAALMRQFNPEVHRIASSTQVAAVCALEANLEVRARQLANVAKAGLTRVVNARGQRTARLAVAESIWFASGLLAFTHAR